MTQTSPGHQTVVAPSCAVCRTPSPSDPPPFTWSAAIGAGHREWTCERCSRENIRSIEGKLDPDWW